MDAQAWRVTLAAAALMALGGGMRGAFGLFVGPLNGASGIGLANLSLALALGQLALGLAQPGIGALADRLGAARVVAVGAVALAGTTALPVLFVHPAVVAASMVLVALAGSAVASNGLLMGEVQRAVPAGHAGFAVGLVGAGLSLGLLVFGPLTQLAIAAWGWATALMATAAASLLACALAPALMRPRAPSALRTSQATPTAPSACRTNEAIPNTCVRDAGMPARGDIARGADGRGDIVRQALRSPSFWRVAASFGACGFHVAFLTTHMPGVIERCGLPPSLAGTWLAVCGAANIAGSVGIGWALRHGDAARWLAALYVARALGVLALLALPPTPSVLLGFAAWMGATYMATLPPTTQLVAREFGAARLGTLFGVVMLVHQVGSFAGAWLGGWTAEVTGGDAAFWAVDIGVALVAAVLVWPTAARRAARPQVPQPA